MGLLTTRSSKHSIVVGNSLSIAHILTYFLSLRRAVGKYGKQRHFGGIINDDSGMDGPRDRNLRVWEHE